MAEKPLTDSINALTTYINGVTGGEDINLSDAVATLAEGYPKPIYRTLIDEYEIIEQQTATFQLSEDLFNNYQTIIIVPNITLSKSDWLYIQLAGVTNIYTQGISFTVPRIIFCKYGDGNYARFVVSSTVELKKGLFANISSLPPDFKYYTWTKTVTMTGSMQIYGMNLDLRKFISEMFNTVQF